MPVLYEGYTQIPANADLDALAANAAAGAAAYAVAAAASVDATAALNSFPQTEGRLVTSLAQFLKNNMVYNVADYAATYDSTGATDMTAAWQACAAAVNASTTGGEFHVPKGTPLITDTITISSHRVTVTGEGNFSSLPIFNPASNKPFFKFISSNAAQALTGCGIKDIGIQSSNTVQKTGIELTDVSDFRMSDTRVLYNFVGNGANYSIGLETRGREFVRPVRCSLSADIPILISQNPRHASIDSDFFKFTDTYLLPTLMSAPRIALGAADQYGITMASNLRSVEHFCVNGLLVGGGAGGLSWVSPAPSQDCIGFIMRDVRIELQTNVNGYFLNIDRGAHVLVGVHLENCSFASNQHGIRLRNTKDTVMKNMFSASTNGAKNVIDLDATCEKTSWEGFYSVLGAGFSLVGQYIVFSGERYSSVDYAIPPFAYYDNTAGDFVQLGVSRIKFKNAAGVVYSGSTSLAIRNSADTANQLFLDDATGNAVFRNSVVVTGPFGCNGQPSSAAIAVGAALNAYAAGGNGLAVAGDMTALLNKVIAHDAALKTIGLLKV